ncbi:MAG TPA: ABC transporter substrate-binding protein [Rhodopila sp.]|uniref:ABC transporter substrate-binding protein n=1 Tax=Rhodopila sp. TaxID=2480087 RepID=UPI002BDC7166|nr:ABC transporter substrate-binding protein [Rhodopila sp.]HVY14737.1 ABC transporter substrate-binding protein [Rhodopila sp.]
MIRPRAADKQKISVGVLTDLSGTYRDNTGPTSVACAQQAIAEFAPSHGLDVEFRVADHQNKPDVAASIARQWCDEGVDALIDVPTSSVALAVSQIVKEKDKVQLNASAAAMEVTADQCCPNTIVWSFDTYEKAHSTGGALMKRGLKTWFFVTADYVFGHSLEEQTVDVVRKDGGQVKGTVRYPFPDTTDFSAFLQQAQASGAQALGLANAGGDTINCIKQAAEFGLNKQMTIAPLLMFLQDVHSVGLETAQGLITSETFYWNMNDRTRAWTKRVLPRIKINNYPSQAHASAYGITFHYLKAVHAMGADAARKSGRAAVAHMKAMPTEDDAFGKGGIRADGRGEFPSYLLQVKTPKESTGEWDLYKVLATTPAAEVLHPMLDKCKFPVSA